MSSLLRVEKLVKFYGQELILKGIDLRLERGDSIAITGSSGSGKSTLLHLIGGLLGYEEGKIYFEEREIKSFNEKERCYFRNRLLGFIYQKAFLIKDLNVVENVILPLKIRGGVVLKRMKEEACELLTALGLADRMKYYPNQLSGGEGQRVAIARALINKPRLVLADEPTGSLDQKTSGVVLAQLLNLMELRNTALIVVTHDLSITKQLKQHYRLENGILIRTSI